MQKVQCIVPLPRFLDSVALLELSDRRQYKEPIMQSLSIVMNLRHTGGRTRICTSGYRPLARLRGERHLGSMRTQTDLSRTKRLCFKLSTLKKAPVLWCFCGPSPVSLHLDVFSERVTPLNCAVLAWYA